MKSIAFTILALAAVATAGAAQGALLGERATITAVIHSIDAKTREIALKTEDGQVTTMVAGEEVKRFHELKVGDRVTFHYLAAVAFQVQRSDKPLSAPLRRESTTRKTSGTPGGVMSIEETAVVAVQSVDAAQGSITVKTHDGKTAIFRVEDKTRLEGIKPGDRIEIAYTEAVAVEVEPAAAPAGGAKAK